MCAKKMYSRSKVKLFVFFIFLENGNFFENITQTKIVDHKIIYKKGPHPFFPLRNTIPKIFLF